MTCKNGWPCEGPTHEHLCTIGHKIRTEVGDPQPRAVRRTAYTDGQGRTIVREDGRIVQGRRVADIAGDLATQRDAWAATHTLKDANPRERRIIRGREELTAAGEQAGASR